MMIKMNTLMLIVLLVLACSGNDEAKQTDNGEAQISIGENGEPNSGEAFDVEEGKIVVSISDFADDEGQVLLALFDEAESFPAKPEDALVRTTATILNKNSTVTLENIPHGNYAISIVHDSNANNKIDYVVGLLPKEGYAFSKNLNPRFGPPKFKDATFEHKSPSTSIKLKVIYYGK